MDTGLSKLSTLKISTNRAARSDISRSCRYRRRDGADRLVELVEDGGVANRQTFAVRKDSSTAPTKPRITSVYFAFKPIKYETNECTRVLGLVEPLFSLCNDRFSA
jgi:hypothetical protein